MLACKLVQTVVSLSHQRNEYYKAAGQLTIINTEIIESVYPQLQTDMHEDAVRFQNVIDSRKARDNEKDSEKSKKLREQALAELLEANEIPLRIAQHSIDVAKKAMDTFDVGFQSARGDSGVAICSSLAGLQGSLFVIYLNLTSFKGRSDAKAQLSKANDLLAETKHLQSQMMIRMERIRNEAETANARGG